jgi:hypothetical protein
MTDPQSIMHRFPTFELSYETIPHKKVSPNYNIAIAIPYGRKYYAWFTFLGNRNVCILMELNREKRVAKTEVVNTLYDPSLALGTVLYGAIEERSQTSGGAQSHGFFVIEDIFHFRGLPMKGMTFEDRLGYMSQTLDLMTATFNTERGAATKSVVFCAPVMARIAESAPYTPKFALFETATMAYMPHHLQYRCLTTTEPVLNVFPAKINIRPPANTHVPATASTASAMGTRVPLVPYRANYSKPQYRDPRPAVFVIQADLQCDIYRLYAYGSNRVLVYYGPAAIPDYHTSVLMNGIFRNIKENRNLDYIEESDEEDEFENTDENRFVDLEKRELMECVFNHKFKKWVPLRSVKQGNMVVHISKL